MSDLAALNDHFLRTAELLGAEPGEGIYHRGVLEGAPFLMTALASTPPTIMFHFRMMEPAEEENAWGLDLVEPFAGLDVVCQIQGDYLFLTVYKALDSTPEVIAALARKCVKDHARLFPATERYCYHCHQAGDSTLRQLDNVVSQVCDPCLEKVTKGALDDFNKLNPFSPWELIYLPAAVVVSGIGWWLFWWGLDSLIDAAGGSIMLPDAVAILVAIGLGWLLGWPVGNLLHSTGIAKRLPAMLLALVTCGATVLVGEVFIAAHASYQIFHFIIWQALPQFIWSMTASTLADAPFYLAIKAIFVFGIGVSIFERIMPRPITVKL